MYMEMLSMIISTMKLSKNDIDDDVVMPNPYNVDFESDSGPDDIDLELDEKEYQ
jgi:hypothetical protein